jgi:excisionase family DNA binding protein
MNSQFQASVERRALRPKDAASVYGVSRTLIYEWIKSGRLASVKLGGALDPSGRTRSPHRRGVQMIAPETPAPTQNADAEDCVALTGASDGAKPAAPPDFAVIYVANRYRLPMHVAALVARLADIGRPL